MTDWPSRSTIDGVDELWDVVATQARHDRDRARSPARTGTNPWDDRTLPLLTAAAGHITSPGRSPTRSGTLPLDELLPPAIKHRDEARAFERARAASPIRGGTRSWDDLLTEMRDEGARMLHVSANDTVFGSKARDPFEDLPAHLLEFLAPGKQPR